MSSIDTMPQEVQSAYSEAVRDRKPENWLSIVRLAITKGVTDPNKLADIPFYLDRPELANRPLRANEDKLVRAWIAIRDNLISYIRAVMRSIGAPDLAHWLSQLNLDHVRPRTEHENAITTQARRRALEKMRDFLAKAADEPHKYDASYRKYIYYDGHGWGRDASERTHFVGGFETLSTQNALSVLQRRVGAMGNKFKNLSPAFADVEFTVYANVDLGRRWQVGTATNDGPGNYVGETAEIDWMAKQARRSTSIYSVYRTNILNVQKAMRDPNPNTAGLWTDWF